jgi:hypothetical protein
MHPALTMAAITHDGREKTLCLQGILRGTQMA